MEHKKSLSDISDFIFNEYTGIFFVNFDEDSIEAVHMSENFLKKYENETMSYNYSDFFSVIISRDVLLEEQDAVRKALDKDFLREYLRKNKKAVLDVDIFIDSKVVSVELKFVNKENKTCGNHVVLFISRRDSQDLVKQFYAKPQKLLIAEDDKAQQEMLKDILEDEGYEVLTADNGIEALKILKEHHKDIACVIVDYIMPECDGHEFIINMRSVDNYKQIPVIVVTGEGDYGVEFKFLRIGATDFIYKPYESEAFSKRIKGILDIVNRNSEINIKYFDNITGLLRKKYFYLYAERFIKDHQEKDFYIVVSDIENFKSINEKYGVEYADEVLSKVAYQWAEMIPGYIMGGRLYNDVFAALVKAGDNWWETFIKNGSSFFLPPISNLKIKSGAVKFDGIMTVQKMCDCAQMAIESIKKNIDTHFAFYDESIRLRLMEEQEILDSMYEALEQNQFKLYFQAKHSISEDKTAGAEILIRWIHPRLGFLNPARFIPIFEKNGFIKKLDRYVFEEMCRVIKEWQNSGKKAIPLSVNVSRRDFEASNFAEEFIALVDQYEIEHSLVHLEVTESAYTDNTDSIETALKILHNAGFIIELDDFGTGYTSLTTLNSMDFDVMKLDMSLVRGYDPNSDRNTLKFAIFLAKLLNLKTVAEGVETLEQKEQMAKIGVDYIQGYYYSKPLPREEFEEYIS